MTRSLPCHHSHTHRLRSDWFSRSLIVKLSSYWSVSGSCLDVEIILTVRAGVLKIENVFSILKLLLFINFHQVSLPGNWFSIARKLLFCIHIYCFLNISTMHPASALQVSMMFLSLNIIEKL